MLGEDQYEALRVRTRREGKSMEQLIYKLLEAGLGATRAQTRRRHKRSGVKGLFREAGVHGCDHDRYLCGNNRATRPFDVRRKSVRAPVKHCSFADCTSVAMMTWPEPTSATVDRDFRRAGFRTLPE